MALTLAPLVTACGPASEGSVGLMVDGDGRVIVMLETCRAVVKSIRLTSRSDKANPEVVWSEAIDQGRDDVQAHDTGLVLADLVPGKYSASADTDDINDAIVGGLGTAT